MSLFSPLFGEGGFSAEDGKQLAIKLPNPEILFLSPLVGAQSFFHCSLRFFFFLLFFLYLFNPP